MNKLIFGEPDEKTLQQFENCLNIGDPTVGILCADNHVGYSHPIGGAILYPNYLSVSGVGFDIGCGNNAICTPLKYQDIKADLPKIMDELANTISFGIGRKAKIRLEHPVLDAVQNANFDPQRNLLRMAESQLATCGSGNHYVNLFRDNDDTIWIADHFGSRGFGYKTTQGFLALYQNKNFGDKAHEGDMMSPPILFSANSQLGQDYFEAIKLACDYANAGRTLVLKQVLNILGTYGINFINNHHNFIEKTEQGYLVRKGCTPVYPDVPAFIGGSMGDDSVIIEGIDGVHIKESLYTAPHGAGRLLSRTQAAGKTKWKRKNWVKQPQRSGGIVNWDNVLQTLKSSGIELRGGGADEAPECYRSLRKVLGYHADVVKIKHILHPIGVLMAGANDSDPYKD